MCTFITPVQNSAQSPNHGNQARRNKSHPNWKEVKLSLSADDTTVYVQNSKLLLDHKTSLKTQYKNRPTNKILIIPTGIIAESEKFGKWGTNLPPKYT